MKYSRVAVVVAVAAAVIWWLTRDDPEGAVRKAHVELASLLSKSEDDGDGTAILESRVLQQMFADSSEVSGDADRLSGVYAPEEVAATALRLQSLFTSIDLVFGEPAIEFADPDHAVAQFSANLTAVGKSPSVGTRTESREVVSGMQRIDGDWLFTGFDLTDLTKRE